MIMTVLPALLLGALAGVYLYSRDIGRRNRAWRLLTLFTGRPSARLRRR
jgi:hypothetical protein